MRTHLSKQELNQAAKGTFAFQRIFDDYPDHVIITDPNATVLYANRSAQSATGFSATEIVGKNPGDLWGGQMEPSFYKRLWKTIKEEKKPFIGAVRNQDKAGKTYWVEMRISPILDKDKNIKYFIGIEPNLSFRNQQEENLLESIGDGVIVIDKAWRIKYLNHATTSITGFNKEEVLLRPMREHIQFIREYDRKENTRFIEEAMQAGSIQKMMNNTVVTHKNGSEIPVAVTAAPIYTKDEQVEGAIIIFHDMLQEREQEMLKSSFAYAAHQLRTPVSKTLWALELALERDMHEEARDMIVNAYKSTQSMNKLVKQLLTTSEIDQRQVKLKREKVQPGKLVRDVVATLDLRAKMTSTDIQVKKFDSASLQTDPRLLHRALYEILDNAISYSPPGSPVVITGSVKKGSFVMKVDDKGVGIPKEEQELVFTKFFRGKNIDTTEIIGAGLGLYISKGHTDILDGKIWFKSKPGNTTFFLSLPI